MEVYKAKPSMTSTAAQRTVNLAFSNAPKTVSYGIAGLILGSIIGGKKGALILGLATACIGYCLDQTAEQGCLVAYRVLRDAIDIDAFGLGDPIDLWVAEQGDVRQKTQSEIFGLKDAYSAWIEAENQTFQSLTKKQKTLIFEN